MLLKNLGATFSLKWFSLVFPKDREHTPGYIHVCPSSQLLLRAPQVTEGHRQGKVSGQIVVRGPTGLFSGEGLGLS